MAIELLSSVTVGSGGTSLIQWTGIPQTGKDLWVLVSGRSSGNNTGLFFKLNDNNTTWDRVQLQYDGTSRSTLFTDSSNGIVMGEVASNSSTSSTFGNSSIYVPNYTTTLNKPFGSESVNENNASAAILAYRAGIWRNTEAVTSVQLYLSGDTLVQNTIASLYIIS